jgi:hypothetical protein
MIRTPKQAIAFVKRHKVVPMTPSGDLASFVVAVAGGPLRGSWWGHPKGALIYDLANALHDSPEVCSVRLVDGKNTFVHRSLWPALYRIVTDASWRRSRTRDLTTLERRLLHAVGKSGRLRLDLWARRRKLEMKLLKKTKDRLTERLLAESFNVHTETGNHATVLSCWESWADTGVKRAAKALSLEEARTILEAACRGRAPAL